MSAASDSNCASLPGARIPHPPLLLERPLLSPPAPHLRQCSAHRVPQLQHHVRLAQGTERLQGRPLLVVLRLPQRQVPVRLVILQLQRGPWNRLFVGHKGNIRLSSAGMAPQWRRCRTARGDPRETAATTRPMFPAPCAPASKRSPELACAPTRPSAPARPPPAPPGPPPRRPKPTPASPAGAPPPSGRRARRPSNTGSCCSDGSGCPSVSGRGGSAAQGRCGNLRQGGRSDRRAASRDSQEGVEEDLMHKVLVADLSLHSKPGRGSGRWERTGSADAAGQPVRAREQDCSGRLCAPGGGAGARGSPQRTFAGGPAMFDGRAGGLVRSRSLGAPSARLGRPLRRGGRSRRAGLKHTNGPASLPEVI